MLTTVIGAYPKPSFLNLTDWFNTNKTDKNIQLQLNKF